MKTIFLDIDGTIFKQVEKQDDPSQWLNFMHTMETEVIHNSALKCVEWHMKGYRIILTTGRPSTVRESCVAQLAKHNIIYDQLIMDLGPFPRYLINNQSDSGECKAIAIDLETNVGISEIDLDEVS